MNEEFMGLSLPPKDFGKPSKAARESTVQANVFAADVPMGMKLYKYRVDLKKIRKEKEIDLTKGIRSEYVFFITLSCAHHLSIYFPMVHIVN